LRILCLAPRSSYHQSQFIFCEPMGLSYVAAVAKRAGHEVRVIQQLTPKLPSDAWIVEEAKRFKPDVLAVSVLSDSFGISQEIVGRLLREMKPPVGFGGKHASINPNIVEWDKIDVAVLGEGEEVFLELLNAYDGTKASLQKVAGLSYCEGGEVRIAAPARRIQDLDSLPFPYREQLPMRRYRMVNIFAIPAFRQRMVSCVSSRGCVYDCLFCPTPRLSQRKWIARSVENVCDEIQHLLERYEPNYLLFHDEDVLLNRKRALELCETMVARGFPKRLKWGCETNIANIDDELLGMLVASGCVFLSFGIESGNAESLKLMRKRMDLDRVTETIKKIRKRMIQTNGNFIIGFPWETREMIMEGFETIKKMELDTAALNVLIPIRGSDLWDIAVRENLIVDNDYGSWHQKCAVMNTRHLSAADVDELYRKVNRRFYFRLGYVSRLTTLLLRRPSYLLGVVEIFIHSLVGRFRQF
jgi:anaerobic magnesium-protoporphyrin IX monomethyl ester cyclase